MWREEEIKERKRGFLEALRLNVGVIKSACEATGVAPSTARYWISDDPEFAAAVWDIRTLQISMVEEALLKNIQAGDTSAITFYLKTQGKHHGYSDRHPSMYEQAPTAPQIEQPAQLAPQPILPAPPTDWESREREVTERITDSLKRADKYSPELDPQIELCAELWVEKDRVKQQMRSVSMVSETTSREGDARYKVSPLINTYKQLQAQLHVSLRSLGMNMDSKAQKVERDSLNDFLAGISAVENSDDERGD